MCTVSMVVDHRTDEWNRRYWPNIQPVQVPVPAPVVNVQIVPFPTQEEIAEFRRLLERAREYDRRNSEPDCELAEKRRLLKEMAERLGVDISFVDKEE